MKFFYRGHSYETKPNHIEGEVSEFEGKYRGKNCKFREVKVVGRHKNQGKMTYRGVSY